MTEWTALRYYAEVSNKRYAEDSIADDVMPFLVAYFAVSYHAWCFHKADSPADLPGSFSHPSRTFDLSNKQQKKNALKLGFEPRSPADRSPLDRRAGMLPLHHSRIFAFDHLLALLYGNRLDEFIKRTSRLSSILDACLLPLHRRSSKYHSWTVYLLS